MPQVPYSPVPSVQPSASPTPSSNVRANAAAFGVENIQAGQRLGAAFEHVGDELFARAYALQEMDQQAAADNAHSAASDAVGKLVMGFREKSGLAAKQAYDPFVKDVESAIDQAGEGLTSDYARKLYRSQTARLRQYTVESAGAHAGAEFKNYQIGTQQSRVDNAIMTASLHPEDDVAYEQARRDIEYSANTMGILKGWSPEQIQEFRNKSHSQLVHDRVTTLARTDPQAAKKILDDAAKGGEVSGEMVGKAGEFIRQQRNGTMSRVESSKLLSGEGFHFGESKVPTDKLYDAIVGVESSGNQRTVTSVTHKNGTKDRALGLGQVLESNLGSWLAEAGMPKMTADEYLNDRDAQMKLIKFKLGQYQEKYGSANEAARHWRGLAFRDSTSGETEPQYLARFNSKLAKLSSSAELDTVAMEKAKKLAPEDTDFHYNFRDRVLAEHSKDRRIELETDFTNRHTVEAALGPSPDGKLPTSIEDISDPAVHAAWDALPEHLRTRYNKVFAANAKNDYAPTTENQREYRAWMGRLTNGMASEEDRKAALDADFISMKLPANQRQELIKLQAKTFKQAAHNPKLEHAMSVLQTQLFNADVTRKADEEAYFQFRGQLHEILQQRLEEGKYPDDKEIKEIGAGLLRETVTSSGRLWDTKGKAFQMEVPDTEMTKIKQIYLDSKGREPTDQEMQQVYAVSQFNQFYAKKPKVESK